MAGRIWFGSSGGKIFSVLRRDDRQEGNYASATATRAAARAVAVEGTLRYQLSSWMMCDICFEKESKGHHGAFFYYDCIYRGYSGLMAIYSRLVLQCTMGQKSEVYSKFFSKVLIIWYTHTCCLVNSDQLKFNVLFHGSFKDACFLNFLSNLSYFCWYILFSAKML